MKIKNINVHLTEEQVNRRIAEMGEEISKTYGDEPVYLICILKGSVFFTCELAKRISSPVEIDFMCVSSYGSGTKSSGVVKISKDLDVSMDKPERRVCEVNVDYIGFQIPDKFVVGYGLDYDQLYRNLPYIGFAEIEE